MNWHAVVIVLFIVMGFVTVGALASMMASFEYDRWPTPLLHVGVVVGSVLSFALLAGAVFA